MIHPFGDATGTPDITVTEDVRTYIKDRGCDFRVCTSCGGPILLPTTIKRPKSTDISIPVGDYTLYISRYQVKWIQTINMQMIPRYFGQGSFDEY
ncbi:MAG: hypothetical protein D5R99_08415 [Methanocalculus sp. MSAO_Arc1]|uniref:hypothetical protein n=1 Tax=Methanocalculus TaxID=71151 RepID=UPI000FF55920|nr:MULTISPECIES: hypothetical protein [unclassified Methanocalculus]MCP1661728.1 hypothetical protein [Methanocalculus sp. AMF5]RQD79399.1 MAG: hypothetical protein D5R99_08415 [Methanocalculus sp. MSAO_Arc1]